MLNKMIRQATLLLCLTLLYNMGSAQIFQWLHAYGNNPRAGKYHDVVALASTGPNGEKIAAIGSNHRSPIRGQMSFSTTNGALLRMNSVRPSGDGFLQAEAICQTPLGDVVFCYFNPADSTSYIVMSSNTGVPIWRRRLPDFHVRDVIARYDFNVPGAVQIWLTGDAPSRDQIALESIDGTGGGIFAWRYRIGGPFRSTTGYELVYRELANDDDEILIVGTAVVDTCPREDMIFLKTNAAGDFITAVNYFDVGLSPYDRYRGRAIVPTILNPNRFALAFQFINGLTGETHPGMLEVNDDGLRIGAIPMGWANLYRDNGMGFFVGDDFKVGGLDQNGDTYMLSGDFVSENYSTGQTSGYSLQVGRNGVAVLWNEYETTGAYPPDSTGLMDLDWDDEERRYVIGGQFAAEENSALPWPQGNIAKSYWLIGADSIGVGDCSTKNTARTLQLAPAEQRRNANRITLPEPLNGGMKLSNLNERDANQCPGSKRAWDSSGLEAEAGDPVATVSYLPTSGRILIALPGEEGLAARVRVMDLQGRVLAAQQVGTGKSYIDASAFSTGLYLIQFEVPGKGQQVKKLLIH